MQNELLPPMLEATDPLHGQLVDLWNRTGQPSTLLLPSNGKFYRVITQYSAIHNALMPFFQELPTVMAVVPPLEIPTLSKPLASVSDAPADSLPPENLLPPVMMEVVSAPVAPAKKTVAKKK